MSRLQCCECGKFIPHSDFDTGKLKSKDVWCGGPIPDLSHVNYWCVRCGHDDPANYVGPQDPNCWYEKAVD